jgi:3-deoxy-D-manno-octulosonic acid (KDO) 8-phosphate synthase
VNAVDPDPAERRLLIMRMIRLLYQADRLKHVCDVVQPADLGFQTLCLLLSEVLQTRTVVDVEGGDFL